MGLMDRFRGTKAQTELIQYSVFVVSDDRATSDLLQSTLQANGYAVASAETGEQALKLLSRMELPHALIGDFTKSEGDAKAFMSKARIRLGKGMLPPVLLLMERPEDEEAAYAISVSDVLPKPFENGQLLRSVQNMIDKRIASAQKTTKPIM